MIIPRILALSSLLKALKTGTTPFESIWLNLKTQKVSVSFSSNSISGKLSYENNSKYGKSYRLFITF